MFGRQFIMCPLEKCYVIQWSGKLSPRKTSLIPYSSHSKVDARFTIYTKSTGSYKRINAKQTSSNPLQRRTYVKSQTTVCPHNKETFPFIKYNSDIAKCLMFCMQSNSSIHFDHSSILPNQCNMGYVMVGMTFSSTQSSRFYHSVQIFHVT